MITDLRSTITAEAQQTLSTFQLYKLLSKDSFVLIYMGVFDDQLTSILMDINDAGKSEMKSSRKKISFLIAECFQNIVRHTDTHTKKALGISVPEMSLLRDRGSIHHLVTTNLVKEADQTKLSDSIDHLKTLSQEELKALYLKVFTSESLSEKGGAGLGLIEMARKSGQAPTYAFKKVDVGFSNFFFQVNVLPKDFQGKVSEKDLSLKPAIEIYDKMTAQKIVLLQKGDFSKEAVAPLIHLFENNLTLKAEDIEVVKKVITLLVEMLENISEHAQQVNGFSEGIFYVTESKNGCYEINTGNFIPVSQSLILKDRLDAITKISKSTSIKTRTNELKKLSDGEKFLPGQGLMEISKYCKGKLVYEFRPIGHNLSFFSLKVSL